MELDLKILVYRWGGIMCQCPVKCGAYFQPVTLFKAYAHQHRFGNAGKALGLEMAHDALGGGVSGQAGRIGYGKGSFREGFSVRKFSRKHSTRRPRASHKSVVDGRGLGR